MKRLALSVICGFAIPFVYAITIGPLSTYVKNDTVNRVIYVPIGWPKLILERLVSLNSFPFRDRDETALLMYMVTCDVVLYAFLSYFFLWGLSTSRHASPSLPPQEPPRSAQQ